MPTPLGDFDFAFQLSELALNEIVDAMHVAGLLAHIAGDCYDGRFVTLVMKPPFLTLSSQLDSQGRAQLNAESTLLYASRAAGDAADSGDTSLVEFTVPISVSFSNAGDPAPLANCAVVIDWSAATAADFTIVSRGTAPTAEVQGALLDCISNQPGWSFPLPPISFGSGTVSSASLAFVNPGGPATGAFLAAGFNMSASGTGSSSQLQTSFLSKDWAVGVSQDYVSSNLMAQLTAQLGSLPPPNGTGNPVISNTTICVVPNPTSWGPPCLGSATQQVFLNQLGWTFAEGKISFSGQFNQVTNSIVVPSISASFQFDATASLDSSGNIQIAFTQPAVQLTQWYANLVNDLTQGAVVSAITTALTTTLSSISDSAGSGLLSVNNLTSLTSLGLELELPLSVTPQSVEIHAYGIVVQGTLDPGPTLASPIAAFQVLPSSVGPTTLLFNAQNSWCPGDMPTLYLWDYGDGATDQFAGIATKFTTSHVYAPGNYQACLTVQNSEGQRTQVCQAVSIVILTATLNGASLSPQGTWQVCLDDGPFTLNFQLFANGSAVPGGTVTLTSPGMGWGQTSLTAADGTAAFGPIAAAQFDPNLPNPPLYDLAGIQVTLTAPGYAGVSATLWLCDCGLAQTVQGIFGGVIQKANNLYQTILDPVIAVMSPNLPPGTGPGDPWNSLVADTVLASAAVLAVAKMAAQASDPVLTADLLGMRAGSTVPEIARRLERTLGRITARLEERAAALKAAIEAGGTP